MNVNKPPLVEAIEAVDKQLELLDTTGPVVDFRDVMVRRELVAHRRRLVDQAHKKWGCVGEADGPVFA